MPARTVFHPQKRQKKLAFESKDLQIKKMRLTASLGEVLKNLATGAEKPTFLRVNANSRCQWPRRAPARHRHACG